MRHGVNSGRARPATADFLSVHALESCRKPKESLFRRDAETSTRDVCAPQNTDSENAIRLAVYALSKARACVFAIEFCNEADADLSGTDRFAFVSVGAIAETLSVHDLYHFEDATLSFGMSLRQKGEVGDFRRSEEHR